MRAVKFKECNVVYAENQLEYLPLPSHRSDDGVVTSCWQLSLWERIRAFFTGRLFLQVMTSNYPLQPLYMSVENPLKESA